MRWDAKKSELNAALLNNRKLWSVLVTSVTRPENPLPAQCAPERRQYRHLRAQADDRRRMANPKPENLGSLISINRELASGLLGRA